MDPDELYGLPLEEFVPRRATLAKELRAAGDRAGAADVAALRKPSVAAWAVNQLIRTQPRAVKELYASGDALTGVQEQLMAGRAEARELREANARERAALDALVALARGLLTSEGNELSPIVLDRVSDTLNAAALDPDARAAVRDGRLERELQHAGLGAFGGGLAPVGSASPARSKRASAEKAKPEAVAKGPDPRGAERARTEARRAVRVAEADARRRADVAQRAVRAAEQRREVAARTLKEADDALARAQAELSSAEEAHRSAKAALDDL
jgi:hypothetical protein